MEDQSDVGGKLYIELLKRSLCGYLNQEMGMRLSYLCYMPLGLVLFPIASLVQGRHFVIGFLNLFRRIPIDTLSEPGQPAVATGSHPSRANEATG